MGATTKRTSSSSVKRRRLTPLQHVDGLDRRVGRIYGEEGLRQAEERVNVAEQELEDLETRLSNIERMVQRLLTHWAAVGQPIPPIPPSLQARLQNLQ